MGQGCSLIPKQVRVIPDQHWTSSCLKNRLRDGLEFLLQSRDIFAL